MTISLRLASGGWWGGDPVAVMEAPADAVLLALQYEDFKGSYESEMINLNRENPQ